MPMGDGRCSFGSCSRPKATRGPTGATYSWNMKIGNISADFGVPILGHKGASRHVREVVAAFGHDGHSVFALSPAVDEGRRFTELHSLLKGSGLATRSEVERTIVLEILTRRAARATSSPPARGTTPSRSTPAGATTASCSQSTPKERRIDDVSDTDGIAVTKRPTSGQFPRGCVRRSGRKECRRQSELQTLRLGGHRGHAPHRRH
jgi:hypothetical protein